MALFFESSQFTSTDDLIRTKLNTFLLAHGWLQDESALGRYAAHVDSLFMSFRWDTAISTGEHNVGVYHALGWVAATDPGNHTNDSGQGVVSGTNGTGSTQIGGGRNADVDNGTHTYWFFLQDSAPKHVHVVVEHAAGVAYRHFGMGHLSKLGTWTGGEYAYADRHSSVGGTSAAMLADSTTLLDGFASGTAIHNGTTIGRSYLASVHMEGMPGQVANGRWGLCWDGGTPALNDRGSPAAARAWVAGGGFRAGLVAAPHARPRSTPLQGLIPLYPISPLYKHLTLEQLYPIGTMPNIRGINVANYAGGDVVTVGAESWVVFPARQKGAHPGTRNQGIAYRKT